MCVCVCVCVCVVCVLQSARLRAPLGTGGDNSNGAVGSFYEGFMATGVTSAATDDAIKKNIVAVQHKTLS